VTYISALEETVARLATERETAYAATNAATTKAATMSPGDTLAATTLNDFQNQLLTKMRNEMKKVLVAAMTAAATGSGARGGDAAKDGGKERWCKTKVTSHYVPTARGMESMNRRIVSHYQQMQTRSPLTSSTGGTSMGKRRNDISRGNIVIAQITSG
jgi:hypothetical protein